MHVNMIALLLIHTSFVVLDLPPSIIRGPYLIHIVPGTSVAAYILDLYTEMVAHI